MLKKILVPLDGSETSIRALNKAIEIATITQISTAKYFETIMCHLLIGLIRNRSYALASFSWIIWTVRIIDARIPPMLEIKIDVNKDRGMSPVVPGVK